MINWESVDSSNVEAMAWKDNSLYVRFHSGGEYKYDGISEDEYKTIISSPSIGRAVNQIKDRYATTKIN